MTTTTAEQIVHVKYSVKGNASIRIKGTPKQVNEIINLLNSKTETNGNSRND